MNKANLKKKMKEKEKVLEKASEKTSDKTLDNVPEKVSTKDGENSKVFAKNHGYDKIWIMLKIIPTY